MEVTHPGTGSHRLGASSHAPELAELVQMSSQLESSKPQGLDVHVVPPAEGFLSVSGEAWKAKSLPLSSELPRSFLGASADAGCHVARAQSTVG